MKLVGGQEVLSVKTTTVQETSVFGLLISAHLAAAASWFLALGADGSAATDFAVTSSLEDTIETFFKDTTICP